MVSSKSAVPTAGWEAMAGDRRPRAGLVGRESAGRLVRVHHDRLAPARAEPIDHIGRPLPVLRVGGLPLDLLEDSLSGGTAQEGIDGTGRPQLAQDLHSRSPCRALARVSSTGGTPAESVPSCTRFSCSRVAMPPWPPWSCGPGRRFGSPGSRASVDVPCSFIRLLIH